MGSERGSVDNADVGVDIGRVSLGAIVENVDVGRDGRWLLR